MRSVLALALLALLLSSNAGCDPEPPPEPEPDPVPLEDAVTLTELCNVFDEIGSGMPNPITRAFDGTWECYSWFPFGYLGTRPQGDVTESHVLRAYDGFVQVAYSREEHPATYTNGFGNHQCPQYGDTVAYLGTGIGSSYPVLLVDVSDLWQSEAEFYAVVTYGTGFHAGEDVAGPLFPGWGPITSVHALGAGDRVIASAYNLHTFEWHEIRGDVAVHLTVFPRSFALETLGRRTVIALDWAPHNQRGSGGVGYQLLAFESRMDEWPEERTTFWDSADFENSSTANIQARDFCRIDDDLSVSGKFGVVGGTLSLRYRVDL